jgi:hypothetical protein
MLWFLSNLHMGGGGIVGPPLNPGTTFTLPLAVARFGGGSSLPSSSDTFGSRHQTRAIVRDTFGSVYLTGQF